MQCHFSIEQWATTELEYFNNYLKTLIKQSDVKSKHKYQKHNATKVGRISLKEHLNFNL